MAEHRAKRRLAAILAADVVGYSRLMELDEAGTLAALKARRIEILDPLIAKFGGRLVKLMGDGVLVEFTSAVDAVQFAIDFQMRTAEANAPLPDQHRIVLRIGINLGDVIVEGSDLYGDGVNVAARLERLGEPGDISVSASVHEQVRRKLDADFEDLGMRQLKNIAEPLRVYRVRKPSAIDDRTRKADPPSPPGKQSIAVLPFTNMGGDAEDVFVDGLTEDVITDLSRNAGLFVIARHSTFAYKGKSIDVRVVARELGVRHILEGSARRAGGRVRINVQLIDAIGGDHIWADRFDRDLEDIFAVQDEVTSRIVEALVGRLTPPPPRSRPKSMEAYDLCVRARNVLGSFAGTADAIREADILTARAVSIEPTYAEACRWRAFALWSLWVFSIEPAQEIRVQSIEHAERAVALDPNDAGNCWMLGYLLAYERRWPESDAQFDAAFRIDPNHADALAMLADLYTLAGKPEEALELIRKALRLNPQPAGWYYWVQGIAFYVAHQYEAACEVLRLEATYRSASRRVLAASLAQLGRLDEARREAALYMVNSPRFTISNWTSTQPARVEEPVQHLADGFRKAGLPE
jgi:TolB-like protein